MTEEKKSSFLDKYKKKEGGDSPGGSGGFASRFSSGKAVNAQPGTQEFMSQFQQKEKPESFAEDKNVKRSQKDAAGFAEDVRKKRSDCVYLVRGKDRGKSAWHYVLVDKPKKEMFLAAARSGSLDVADYGEVLYSGWGEDPPEDIKKKIDEQYS